jgi:hypothetical protein
MNERRVSHHWMDSWPVNFVFFSFFLSFVACLAPSPSLFLVEGNYRNKLKNKAALSFICYFLATITNITN